MALLNIPSIQDKTLTNGGPRIARAASDGNRIAELLAAEEPRAAAPRDGSWPQVRNMGFFLLTLGVICVLLALLVSADTASRFKVTLSESEIRELWQLRLVSLFVASMLSALGAYMIHAYATKSGRQAESLFYGLMTYILEAAKDKRWLVFGFVISLAALTVVLLLSHTSNMAIGHYTRDVQAVAVPELGSAAGFLSQVGIMLWSAALALSLATYFILLLRGTRDEVAARRFLLGLSLLTLALLLDDAFMLHERVFPSQLSMSELVFVSFYPMYTVLLLFVFRREVLQSRFLPLLTSLSCFAVSLLIDQIELPGSSLVEDGAKFTGIVFWLIYISSFSFGKLRASFP